MNMKYLFGLLFLAFFSLNAYGDFKAEIIAVDGRGSFSDNGLLIGNCNDPTKSQVVYLTFDLDYPSDDCSGKMEIFYSYYDFPSENYTDEKQLCFINSGGSCKGAFNINLGGTGTSEINVEDYVKIRAVCNSNSQEFNHVIPLSINHFPINTELDALDKISLVDSILYDAKTILDECSKCDSNPYYEVSSDLDALKYQISSCDFTSYVVRYVEIKEDAEELKTNYEKIASAYPLVNDNEDTSDMPGLDEEEMNELINEMDDAKKEMNNAINKGLEEMEQAPSGVCLIGLMFPLLVLGLYVYR